MTLPQAGIGPTPFCTAGNVVMQQTFDDAGRLTGLTHAKGANTLADYGWTYDVANRVTGFTSPDGSSTYTYDDTDQLVGADHTYQTDETYSYDANGNRTNPGYQTGTNNRLLSDGTYNYEYDAEGNRTRRTTIATGDYVDYEWDHPNRLTAVRFKTAAGATTKQVEYDYDLFDRRIGKRVDANGDGVYETASRFVYDGQDIVLVFDDSGALQQRFLHGPAIDQVLASEDALGEILWGLPDNQGTIRDVADYDAAFDTTTIAKHLKYNAFGAITADSAPALDFLYAYTGREWDGDAELYYYRARWYDPRTARFLSEDPIYDDFNNPYRYVGNSPTNFTDPSGLVEQGAHWFNDGPWDWYNPVAYIASWGYSLGESIGNGIGSAFLKDYDSSFALYRARQNRIAREMADPALIGSPDSVALPTSQAKDILHDGLCEFGTDAYNIADGAAAAAELGMIVAGVAEAGVAIRSAATSQALVRQATKEVVE